MFNKVRLAYFLVISFLFVLAYFAFLGRDTSLEAEQTIDQHFSSECDLSRADCSLHLADQFMVSFRLAPKNIVPLERFELLMSSDIDAIAQIEGLKLWLEGRDMDMGRHYLIPQERIDNADTSILAQGMIPVCTVDPDMVWRMVVVFNYQGKRMQIHFDVPVTTHGR